MVSHVCARVFGVLARSVHTGLHAFLFAAACVAKQLARTNVSRVSIDFFTMPASAMKAMKPSASVVKRPASAMKKPARQAFVAKRPALPTLRRPSAVTATSAVASQPMAVMVTSAEASRPEHIPVPEMVTPAEIAVAFTVLV